MIDIHSHIVWDLDDGASSIEDSLAMLRTASEDGITDIVATPHSNARYQFHPALLRQRTEELARRSEGKPVIHRGCEFHLNSDNIAPMLDSPSTYTINAGPYLLLEFPDFHIGTHTESILRQLLDAGIVPIVAHPERNPFLLRDLDRLESWIDLGCLAQVTARSITGGFGGPSRSAAFRLLDRGLVHVVATDAHDPQCRPPTLSAAYQVVRVRFGEDVAELLFTDNPRDIIQRRPLPGGKLMLAGPHKRRWWQFGLGSTVDLTKGHGYLHR
jgi:protein-tyrosine phosphatase